MKNYVGRKPDEKEGWALHSTYEHDGLRWGFYIKPQDHNEEWITCKLVADGKAPKKANYWFTLNINQMRFGFGRDLITLQEHRMHLYLKLFEELDKYRN